mgnify:CR=1 FL=1
MLLQRDRNIPVVGENVGHHQAGTCRKLSMRTTISLAEEQFRSFILIATTNTRVTTNRLPKEEILEEWQKRKHQSQI